MKQALLVAALIGVCSVPLTALAQNCRNNFGGNYTVPHSGVKPDGNFFTTTAFFDFNPTGTFKVVATIVEPFVPTSFPANVFSHWWWIGPCDIAIDRAAFVGHLSSDGRVISVETFDAEQLTGLGSRDSARPERSLAQTVGVEGAFSANAFGRQFAGGFADQLATRAAALRAGATGLAIGPVRLAQLPAASDAGRTIVMRDGYGGFFSGQILLGDRTILPSEPARSFTTGGATLGLDYRLDSASVIGLAGGYLTGDLNVAGGSTNGRGGALSLYGITETGPLYADGYVGGGLVDYHTSRSFDFASAAFSASGAPGGNFVTAGSNFGYRFERPIDRLRWGPVAELRFNRVSVGGYDETGLLGAHVMPGTSTSLQSGFGGEIAVEVPTQLGIVTPHLRATWRHEYADVADIAVANFLASTGPPVTVPITADNPTGQEFPVSAGPSTKVTSARLGRDFVAVAAGIAGQLMPGVLLSADYVGELGRANETIHQVSLSARIAF